MEQRLNTAKSKETSDRIAHLAAVVLRRTGIAQLEKELAGSALAQHHTSKQTSKAIGSLAAKVLADHVSCHEAKELAGCVLSQVRHVEGPAPAR
ncbi:hypothetical protein [Paraburkholderia aromaticivorans]|uniref:ANTAR domain-containing protein n=1 Tax=Paraburkholderia aromaticivorans TaxID=2026199 RepID=A0A248VMK0_9BURK|nr:hypothetical protein [Paraburkholderia aromaticivorans]ASW00095.1 hypothetical protein CJU94_19245 [Paraburkholderia aromaticivorans]